METYKRTPIVIYNICISAGMTTEFQFFLKISIIFEFKKGRHTKGYQLILRYLIFNSGTNKKILINFKVSIILEI